MRAARARHIAAGLCAQGCGRARTNAATCATCEGKKLPYARARAKRLRAAGQCVKCARPALEGLSRCAACRTKLGILAAAGSMRQAPAMLALFEQQGGLCAYTGVSIELGTTASIDHRVPRSKGGTDDLSNLHWVHRWVNFAKRDLSEDDFIAMCALVTKHARARRLAARALRKCFAGATAENDNSSGSDSSNSEQDKAVGQ